MKNIVFAVPEVWQWRSVIDRLTKEGYTVSICENADESVRLVREQKECMLIIDQVLPHGTTWSKHRTEGGTKTGQVVAEDLLKERPNLPIILISSTQKEYGVPNDVYVTDIRDLTAGATVRFVEKAQKKYAPVEKS